MPVRVRAKGTPNPSQKYVGYYNYVRRKPGDVFDLLGQCPQGCSKTCKQTEQCKHPAFSRKWMAHVGADVQKTPAPGEPTPQEVAAQQKGGKKGSGDQAVI